jgi:hypothetical protein
LPGIKILNGVVDPIDGALWLARKGTTNAKAGLVRGYTDLPHSPSP